MLFAVMTLCLVSIATLYILSYIQKKTHSEVSYNSTTIRPPASSPRPTQPIVHPNITTFRPTAPVTSKRPFIASTTGIQGIAMTTTRARSPKTFPPIGKPHNCDAPDVPDISCPTYCCISQHPHQSLATVYPSLEVTGLHLSPDDNSISSPGPEAAGRGRGEERDTVREAARREHTHPLEEELEQMSYTDQEPGDIGQGGEEGDVGAGEGEGVQEVTEILHRSDNIANADTDIYSARPGQISSFIQDPKQGEYGGLKESSRHRPITHSQAPLPRTGRDESESISKKELSPQNQIQLSFNTKPDKEEEEDNKVDVETGDNSTSQDDWIGSGRKSTKSVLSSLNNNVVFESDKISPREGKNSSSRRNIGLRKRRAVEDTVNYKPEDTYGEAGCGLRHQIHVQTGTGRVNLSEDYCTGCDSNGNNCSYLVPLSEHMPDSNISLLLPVTAVSCPISSLAPPTLCPQVNEIEEVEQEVLRSQVEQEVPSNLQTFTEDVRTRLSIQLQYRIPAKGTQDIEDICSLPSTLSHLGTAYTQINVRVKRNCGE